MTAAVLSAAACDGTRSVSFRYSSPPEAGRASNGPRGYGGRSSGGANPSGGEPDFAGALPGGAPSDAGAGGALLEGGVESAGAAGSCSLPVVPAGSFVRFTETPCHALVCDGAGNTMQVVDARNVPAVSDDCQVRSCSDDGAVLETQAPLGASCGAAHDQRCDASGQCVDCISSADCDEGQACIQGVCQVPAPSCSNQHLDGGETDVDCGGSCTPCSAGLECYQDADCASQYCDAFAPERCVNDHCLDHHLDGDETDVDCGGTTCDHCKTYAACKLGSDCSSGLCHDKFHFCLPEHCSNDIQDQGETGLDCGGGCYGCSDGNDCTTDADCLSFACDYPSLECIADQCQDQHVDGEETDDDCGGPTCAPCGIGKKCQVPTDCAPGTTCGGVPKTCN